MKVYKKDIDRIDQPIVVAIGFFDGMHKGHQFLVDQVKAEAKKRSLRSVIITFVEHPRQILQADYQPALLSSFDLKLDLLAKTGIDICIPLHFTKELSQLSAYSFMKEVLKENYNVDTLVIGYDHRFGHDRSEGFEQYVEYGTKIGMSVIQANELDTGEYVSSSLIRELLDEGKVQEAAKLLGYNYTISGKIIEGLKIGRTIGFPTANVELRERLKVIPAHGVYAVHVYSDEMMYNGMLYIGRRPTIQDVDNVSIEVNIFDFDGDLYGKELTIEFIQFVRRDVKFGNLSLLKMQLQADKERIKEILGVKQ